MRKSASYADTELAVFDEMIRNPVEGFQPPTHRRDAPGRWPVAGGDPPGRLYEWTGSSEP